MKVHFKIILKQFFRLEDIDFIVFIVLLNLNLVDFLSRELQIFLSLLVIRKYLLNHTKTIFLEPVLFLAGRKVSVIIIINFLFYNSVFIFSSLFFFVTNLNTAYLIDNILLLNVLIVVSGLIKYWVSFKFLNNSFTIRLLEQSIYFFSYYLFHLMNFKFKIIFILLTIICLIKTTNRTLVYHDFNK